MSWFLFAILGYFFYALAVVVSKYLLRQPATTRPLVFTFWVGILSIFVFVLMPFGLHWPGWNWFCFDLFIGALFFFALVTFYWALDINEASRAAPVIGGLSPVLVLFFSFFFLAEKLDWLQLMAFFFLVLGGFFISLENGKDGFKEKLKNVKVVIWAIILSAIYWVSAKFAFNAQGFITGFIWTRLGLVLISALILFFPDWRRQIFGSIRQTTGKVSILMVSGKFLASFGSLFVHLALSRASAPLVQALQGTEYVFLFLLTVFLSKKFPEILKEKLNITIIFQKTAAILFICVGLAILAF